MDNDAPKLPRSAERVVIEPSAYALAGTAELVAALQAKGVDVLVASSDTEVALVAGGSVIPPDMIKCCVEPLEEPQNPFRRSGGRDYESVFKRKGRAPRR